jgi:hypothetical protein
MATTDKGKESNYDVGYGKPPTSKRFAKGKSGNPSGRAKGPRPVEKQLMRALNEPVVVNENGERRQITKIEAMLKQLVNQGASGDPRAIQMLLGQIRGLIDPDPAETAVADDTPGQLLMLERLTVAERIELRRLIAKAQGTHCEGSDAGIVHQGAATSELPAMNPIIQPESHADDSGEFSPRPRGD